MAALAEIYFKKERDVTNNFGRTEQKRKKKAYRSRYPSTTKATNGGKTLPLGLSPKTK